MMAGTTGLEPATSAVTGQRSDQLSYVPKLSLGCLENAGKNAELLSGNIHECTRNARPSAYDEARSLPKSRPTRYPLRDESLEC